jgi:hypothetical protein
MRVDLEFPSLVLVLHKYDGIYLQYLLCISLVIVTVTVATVASQQVTVTNITLSKLLSNATG